MNPITNAAKSIAKAAKTIAKAADPIGDAAKSAEKIVHSVANVTRPQAKAALPADKRIYALRDVTATVESIPLIVASILSKKLAEGIDALVLDVKVGRGAFMKTAAQARALAEALVRVGTRAGKKVVALLTDMNAPLGVAVGNANETREALDILHGKGPADLRECTLLLGAEMLVLGGRAANADEARTRLEAAIAKGDALAVMEKMVAAQHGDARVVGDPSRLEVAKVDIAIAADRDGFVTAVDALEIGLSAVAIGAGRTRTDQAVDPTVGISVHAKPGARVRAGDTLAHIHVRTKEAAAPIVDRVRAAFVLGAAPPTPSPLLQARIT